MKFVVQLLSWWIGKPYIINISILIMLENVILVMELLQGIFYGKWSVLYFGLVFTVILRLYVYDDQGA